MDTTAFAQLQRDVPHLKDRQEIQVCVHRHARGHDRFDVDLLGSAYNVDEIDEHDAAINTGPDHNAVHTGGSQLCLRNITTPTCEIYGDIAHAESYVLVGLLNPDGASVPLIIGRHVDRLETRVGVWRIALRRCTVDLLLSGDASILTKAQFRAGGYIRGTRDKSDVSYQRPLDLG